MRRNLTAILLASAVAACTAPHEYTADRGVEAVNQPVLNRSTFVLDVAAPDGMLAPEEVGRLDGWFQGLDLGYGDSIFVDGAYSDAARAQVSSIAGKYGMLVLPAAPVTAGVIQPGMVRVVVSRTRAEVPGCPNWSVPSQPNYKNRMMSNFGCSLNSDLAQMVADPQDLFHGREGNGYVDAITAAKAIQMYRKQVPTGEEGLKDISTKKDK